VAAIQRAKLCNLGANPKTPDAIDMHRDMRHHVILLYRYRGRSLLQLVLRCNVKHLPNRLKYALQYHHFVISCADFWRFTKKL